MTRGDTDGLTVDLVARTATGDGHDIPLSPAERHPLEILITSTGRLVPQEDLPREVWGPTQGDRTPCLRVYMARLRRKLEADPSRPRHLVTEPGTGYPFET